MSLHFRPSQGRRTQATSQSHRHTPYEIRLFLVFRLLCVFCLFAFVRSVCVNKIQFYLSCHRWLPRYTIDAKSILRSGMPWCGCKHPTCAPGISFCAFSGNSIFFFGLLFWHGNMSMESIFWNKTQDTPSTESPFHSASNTEKHTLTRQPKKKTQLWIIYVRKNVINVNYVSYQYAVVAVVGCVFWRGRSTITGCSVRLKWTGMVVVARKFYWKFTTANAYFIVRTAPR